MLKRKSNMFKAFMDYKAKVERITGHKIKKLRTEREEIHAERIFRLVKERGNFKKVIRGVYVAAEQPSERAVCRQK